MFMPFMLFAMYIMATGKSDVQTLSPDLYGNDVFHIRRHSCKAKCKKKCRNGIRCTRCYAKCWLIKGYRLDSGYMPLCN